MSQRSALEKLKQGQPVILLVQLHDLNTKETYYGHWAGMNGDEVTISYAEHEGLDGIKSSVQASFSVQDVLQVSPTTEEGLGKWGRTT